MIDHQALVAKTRREQIRWFLLTSLNISRPFGMNTVAMLPIIQATYADATHTEVRRELDYLEERELVKVARGHLDEWSAELTRIGVDLVEYTIPCEPGIARPRIQG